MIGAGNDALPLFLYSMVIGGILGAIYDVFRIRRIAFAPTNSYGYRKAPVSILASASVEKKTKKSDTVLIFCEDLLFSVIAAVLFLLLFYATHSGKVRGVAFVGAGGAFFLYRLTVGRCVMRFSSRIVAILRAAVRFFKKRVLYPLFRILLYPFRLLFRWTGAYLLRKNTKRAEKKLYRMARAGQLPVQRKKRG